MPESKSESVSPAAATVLSWPSIELLYNLIRTLSHLEEREGQRPPTVTYRAKVKQHGTNCAIQVHPDRHIVCQGRTTLLTPESDNRGFATWVNQHRDWFADLPEGTVLYGEWCGPGVERGVAVSQLPHKIFAIFTLQRADTWLIDPDAIRAALPAPPAGLHVLPWQEPTLTVDFADRASLEAAAALLSECVTRIEAEDPWVRETFGLSGTGEGLVLYPTSVGSDRDRIAALLFKAKGEKHRTVATPRAVTVDPATASSAATFAALVLTEARLQQALQAVCGGVRDRRHTGAFLAWLIADIRKECAAELEASHLTWPDAERTITARARTWLLET